MPTFRNFQNQALDFTFKEVKVRASKMIAQYKKAKREIRQKIKRLYKIFESQDILPDQYFDFMMKFNRLGALNDEIDRIYKPLLKEAGNEIERASRLSLSNQYYRNQYALSWATPQAFPSVTLSFNFIDPVAIETSVYHTTSVWKAIKDQARKAAIKPAIPKGRSYLL